MSDENREEHPVGREEIDVVVHEYDGIEEYDNQLPRWWLWTLFGAIGFGVVYWFGYQTFHAMDNPRDTYDKEVAVARAAEIERMKNAGPVTAELLAAMSKDQKTLQAGKAIFIANCVACHRADAGGNIGPNLTDKYWLHGSKPDEVYKTVTEGVPTKGMISWAPILGPEKAQAATAYVLSLKDTNVAAGKPPQGEPD